MPALILSGGEPLLRRDIFEISRGPGPWGSTSVSTNGARSMGQWPSASPPSATTMSASAWTAGGDHDRSAAVRRLRSVPGGRPPLPRAAGSRSGLRFTVTSGQCRELPAMLDADGGGAGGQVLPLRHLYYSGRGDRNRGRRMPTHRTTRRPWTSCSSAAGTRLDGAASSRVRDRQQRRGWGLPAALGRAPLPRTGAAAACQA